MPSRRSDPGNEEVGIFVGPWVHDEIGPCVEFVLQGPEVAVGTFLDPGSVVLISKRLPDALAEAYRLAEDDPPHDEGTSLASWEV
jgi:hypothetical protein